MCVRVHACVHACPNTKYLLYMCIVPGFVIIFLKIGFYGNGLNVLGLCPVFGALCACARTMIMIIRFTNKPNAISNI